MSQLCYSVGRALHTCIPGNLCLLIFMTLIQLMNKNTALLYSGMNIYAVELSTLMSKYNTRVILFVVLCVKPLHVCNLPKTKIKKLTQT